MIVDAVLANEEWDLVLFRMRYLSPLVEKFYVGESSVTFSGMPKEALFSARLAELEHEGFNVEVVTLNIPDGMVQSGERWAIETYARNRFMEAVAEKHLDDLLLFSDVDEVPSRDQVKKLIDQGDALTVVSVPTHVCLRKANWIEYYPQEWRGKWGNALFGKYSVPRIRRGSYQLAPGEPGVHLSYVGMATHDVRRKYRAFSHGELDRDEIASEEFLRFTDHFHISHLGRALEPGAGLLTVASEDQLTEIQRAVRDFRPGWCDFSPVSTPRHRRLVASWLVFSMVRGKTGVELGDAFAPLYSWRWLRHAVVYALVWSGWKLLNMTGLMRVFRKQPPGTPA